jgi:hypothetical protein
MIVYQELDYQNGDNQNGDNQNEKDWPPIYSGEQSFQPSQRMKNSAI